MASGDTVQFSTIPVALLRGHAFGEAARHLRSHGAPPLSGLIKIGRPERAPNLTCTDHGPQLGGNALPIRPHTTALHQTSELEDHVGSTLCSSGQSAYSVNQVVPALTVARLTFLTRPAGVTMALATNVPARTRPSVPCPFYLVEPAPLVRQRCQRSGDPQRAFWRSDGPEQGAAQVTPSTRKVAGVDTRQAFERRTFSVDAALSAFALFHSIDDLSRRFASDDGCSEPAKFGL